MVTDMPVENTEAMDGESVPNEDGALMMSPAEIERLLGEATIEAGELVPKGSNYTFAVQLQSII